MEGIRFPVWKFVTCQNLQLIVLVIVAVLAGPVSSQLLAAPQNLGEHPQ